MVGVELDSSSHLNVVFCVESDRILKEIMKSSYESLKQGYEKALNL